MASLVAISIMVMMTIFKSGKTIDYYDESAKQTAHESLDKHVTMYLIYTLQRSATSISYLLYSFTIFKVQ